MKFYNVSVCAHTHNWWIIITLIVLMIKKKCLSVFDKKTKFK